MTDEQCQAAFDAHPYGEVILQMLWLKLMAAVTEDADVLGSLIDPRKRVKGYLDSHYPNDPPEFRDWLARQFFAQLRTAARGTTPMTLSRDVRAMLRRHGCHVLSGSEPFVRGTLPDGTLLYLVCLAVGEPLSHRRKCHLDAHTRAGEVAAVVRTLDDVRRILDNAGAKRA